MKGITDKSRMISLFLFAIFVIVVGIIISVYHIFGITEYGKEFALKSYIEDIESTVNIIKQNVEYSHENLIVTANIIGQEGDISKEKMMNILPMLIEGQRYIELSVVDLNGYGYNSQGYAVDVSTLDFFLLARDGREQVTNSIFYSDSKEPVLNYSIPIYYKETTTTIGVLLASISADLSILTSYCDPIIEKDNIYILNRNNEPLFSNKVSELETFDYQRISKNKNFFLNDFKNIGRNQYKNGIISPIKSEGDCIWLQTPLGVNDLSVLVGTSRIANTFSYNMIRISNSVLLIIVSFICILFIIFTFTLCRTNRRMTKAIQVDPITGGHNWYKFRSDVDRILKSRQFFKRKFAFINFDINRFKVINDSFGYQKGDEVLKEIYQILKCWVEPGELFTRYAADQFYIILCYQRKEDLEERLTDLNYYLHQSEYLKHVKFYFGVYFIKEIKDSVDRMGDFATVVKQRIKGSNDVSIAYFDEATRQSLLEEELVEKKMHEALRNEEFILYLQPKILVGSETISGAEALVRWKNDQGGMISPGYFISIFEKNGFITQLDLYMLRKSCEVLQHWMSRGITTIPISVNMSRIHFTNPDLAEMIERIVDEYNIPHELIELELTESAFLQNKKMLIETVNQLRVKGFMISMDDFGSGYSSLNSLKDIPLDVVKLDGELFRITEELERGLIVIRNTILMAKELQMKVVAECIETKEQVEFLKKVGCDIIQGYYYAKPMPVQEFEKGYIY